MFTISDTSQLEKLMTMNVNRLYLIISKIDGFIEEKQWK